MTVSRDDRNQVVQGCEPRGRRNLGKEAEYNLERRKVRVGGGIMQPEAKEAVTFTQEGMQEQI